MAGVDKAFKERESTAEVRWTWALCATGLHLHGLATFPESPASGRTLRCQMLPDVRVGECATGTASVEHGLA